MAALNKEYGSPEKIPAALTEPEMIEEDSVDLYALLIKLIEKWYVIVASALICAIVTAIVTLFFITPQYKSTAKIYVINNKDSAINLSDLQISTYLTNDYKEVFYVWEVHELVRQKMNLDYSYDQMERMISVENPANTRIVGITVTAADPVEAMQMANTYAEVAREYIATKMDTAMPTVLEEALASAKPASPNKTLDTIIGFFAGALIAMLVIAIRFLRDDYIRTADDIERWIKLPVLGTVMMQMGPGYAQRDGKGKEREE